MKSVFLFFIIGPFLICAQVSEQEKKHNIFFEHNYGLQLLSHSEYAFDGSGDPESLLYRKYVQLTSNINFLYQNKYINGGVGSTVLTIGPKVQWSRIQPFNFVYDVYLRLGFNFLALAKKTRPDFRIGPYATIGFIRPTFYVYYANYNYSLGFEMYKRNFRLSASIGFYNFDKEEKAKQNLDSYYKTNNIIAIQLGWCLPNHFSKRKSQTD